jgi:hypothetical protein
MVRNFMFPPCSTAAIWSADSTPCGAQKAPRGWPTQTLTTTQIRAPKCIGRLKRKKGALPSMFAPVILQKATGSAHDDAEVLVLKLKWPLLPRTLDLNQIALVLW